MAMRLNPVTGQYEDDGIPELDGAAPVAQPDPLAMPGVGPENLQTESGGNTSAPGQVAVPVMSAKPEWENKTSKEVKSSDVVVAEQKQEDARKARDESQAADTAIKVEEAQAKADDAKLARLAAEREEADRAYWEDQKRRKTEENKAADKLAREESAQDEKLKNEAGNLTGAAKTWATILTAIGTIGQGLAAAGSRGAQAWADGNPIAKLYEEDRQKAVAKAIKDFEASERHRALEKEGRTEEIEHIKEELTIGVNNRVARDKLVQGSILAERVAKLGPNGAKVAGELLRTGQQALDATTDLENATRYNSREDRVTRAPTAGAGTAGGKPTEGNSNAAARIQLAEGNLADVEKHLKDVPADELAKVAKQERLTKSAENPKNPVDGLIGEGLRAIDVIPEGNLEGVSAATRAVVNGLNEFVENALNSATGAAYSNEQKAAYRQKYGFAPGDTPEMLREKLAGARQWVEAEKLKAGKLATPAANDNARTPTLRERAEAKLKGRGKSPGFTPETKTISSGTWERTGPGPKDWKRVAK